MKHASLFFLLLPLLSGCGARTIEAGFDELAEEDDAGDSATTSETTPVSDDGIVFPGEDATPTPDDAPIATDAGGPPVSRPIACGMATCDSAKQECCIPLGMMGAPTCTTIGTCKGAALSCTSSSSCAPGQKCCLEQDMTPTATCKSACAGGGPGTGGELTLCTTNDECPMGLRCRRVGAGLSGCIRG